MKLQIVSPVIRTIGLVVLFILTAIPQWLEAQALDEPVHVQSGLVQGTRLTSGVEVFKGIPFAAPPLGDLRWREPRVPAAWNVIRRADRFGDVCLQTRDPRTSSGQPQSVESVYGVPASEDCLYLNLWTPAKRAGQRLPVMVWIYGGGYVSGGASRPEYDGETFARDGVILVDFNYRGGALGYLVHPELTRESPNHTSGNYGSLDQIAALKWVKTNIAAFGGDPDNVTVFGESGGSGSVNMLQASPLAKGLFRRAIGESTTQLDATTAGKTLRTFASAEQDGLAFQKALNANSIEDLRKLSATAISTPLKVRTYPVQGDGYFLPSTVYDMFATGKQNDVAVIVGSNANEGENLTSKRVFPGTPQEAAAYARLYDADANGEAQSIADALAWQAQQWAAFERQTGHQASYVYVFARAWPFKSYDDWGFPLVGAFHTSEIPYVFDNLNKIDGPWTALDQGVAHSMHAYWVNFAKTGTPNGPGLSQWPIYDPRSTRVMVFSETPHAQAAPRPNAHQFLDAYYKRILSGG